MNSNRLRRPHQWLIDTVVEAGLLAPAQVPDLRELDLSQAWQLVGERCDLSPQELAQRVAQRYQLELADLSQGAPQSERPLPERLLMQRLIRVLRDGPDGLVIATADPSDHELLRQLQFAVDVPVTMAIAPPQALLALAAPPTAHPSDAAQPSGVGELDLDAAQADAPAIIRLSDQLLRHALDQGVSDIHIQPLDAGGVVRLRKDGVLHNAASLPRAVLLRLVARLKLLATMDPTDSMRPQDGRLRLRHQGQWRDARVSSVPANGAEKLVLRVLGTITPGSLSQLGLRPTEQRQLGSLLSRSQGLVLVTGPTGSGKTTTLYSALGDLSRPEINVATVEDPVEIRMRWLTQIEVNPKADLTFASALRSVLRQDPNVILIGEIRDAETAQIAVQAAITGHLVLATLHAHDAIGAVPRLLDLGVSRQLVAEALAGATGQRLMRRLCAHCKTPDGGSSEALRWLREHAGLETPLCAPGCPACGFSGYKGRLPIAQTFSMSPTLAVLLEDGSGTEALRTAARAEGMRSLAEHALEVLQAGDTSLDEVVRVLGSNFWRDLAQARTVPLPPELPSTRAATELQERPVLVIAQDAVLRDWVIHKLGAARIAALAAQNAVQGSELLQRHGAVRAILIDFSGLNPEQVQALLALRQTLSAAAIPIWGVRDPGDPAIERVLAAHRDIVTRPKALRPELLDDWVDQVIDLID